jgi:hypothetical protein
MGELLIVENKRKGRTHEESLLKMKRNTLKVLRKPRALLCR